MQSEGEESCGHISARAEGAATHTKFKAKHSNQKTSTET